MLPVSVPQSIPLHLSPIHPSPIRLTSEAAGSLSHLGFSDFRCTVILKEYGLNAGVKVRNKGKEEKEKVTNKSSSQSPRNTQRICWINGSLLYLLVPHVTPLTVLVWRFVDMASRIEALWGQNLLDCPGHAAGQLAPRSSSHMSAKEIFSKHHAGLQKAGVAPAWLKAGDTTGSHIQVQQCEVAR